MLVVSTSHFYSRLLASNTLGTTCLAICMFTSTHAFLSFDCGTLTGFDTRCYALLLSVVWFMSWFRQWGL